MNHINELAAMTIMDADYEQFQTITELTNSVEEAGYGAEMNDLFGEKLRLAGVDTDKPLKDQLYKLDTTEEMLGISLASAIAVEVVIEIIFKTGEIIFMSKTNKALVSKKKLEITHRDDYDVLHADHKIKAYSYQDVVETLQKALPVIKNIHNLTAKDIGPATVDEMVSDVGGKIEDGKFIPPNVTYKTSTIKEHGWNSDTLESIHPLMVDAAKMLRVMSAHLRQVSKTAKASDSSNSNSIVELRKLTSFVLPFTSRCVLKHIAMVKLSKRNYLANT